MKGNFHILNPLNCATGVLPPTLQVEVTNVQYNGTLKEKYQENLEKSDKIV